VHLSRGGGGEVICEPKHIAVRPEPTAVTVVTICNCSRTRLPSSAGWVKLSGQEQLNVMIYRHRLTMCPFSVLGPGPRRARIGLTERGASMACRARPRI
jgi:hypothetical protein